MRNVGAAALSICAAAFVTSVCCGDGSERMRETLVKRTEERLQAANRGDKADYGRDLLASGIFTDGNGIPHTTKDMIDDVAPPSPPRVLQFRGMKDVRFVQVGDTAVLNYILEQSDRIGDRESLVEYRKTDVFARVNGEWTLVAMQASVIPARPAAGSNSTPAEPYVGDYEIATGVAATIRVEGGELRVHYPGEPTGSFVHQSDASIVRLDGLRRIDFSRDAAGRVKGLTFRRYPGGGDMPAQKTR